MKPIERAKLLALLAPWRAEARPTRVLVIEDDPDQLAFISAALAQPNWEIVEAANGRLALEKMQSSPPDVVVLDLMMPEMDGFEFMAAVQTNPDWRNIPVFVVTALDLSEQDRRRLNVGIEKILSKANFSTRDLVARIKGHCARFAAGVGCAGGCVMTRALCVEDNDDNIYLLKMRLELIEGFEITVAKDGAEAINLATADPPDFILMDMNLPVMDGWEATRRLKADPRTTNIPIIALTAHAMSGDRERALAAGCDEFDTKPIDFDQAAPRYRGRLIDTRRVTAIRTS